METDRKDDLISELECRYLECSICSELFDDHELVPRYLPCQHTFCSKCLLKLCRNNEIKCPSCNAVYKFTRNDVNDLPKDNTRRDLIYFLQDKSRSKTISCTVCKKQSPRQFKCISCDQILCERCKINHVANNPYHCRLEIKDSDDKGNFNKCKNPQHKNAVLTLFCITCNTGICNLCKVNEHSDPKYHETEEITQTVKRQKKCLRLSAVLLEEKMANLKYQKIKMKDTKTNIERNCQEYTAKVDHLYDKGTQILKQQKEIILENHKNLMDSLKKDIDYKEKRIEEYLANAEDCYNIAEELLNGNDVGYFLSANKTINSHVQHFLDESFEIAGKELDMKITPEDKSIAKAEELVQHIAKINAELQLRLINQESPTHATGYVVDIFKTYVTKLNVFLNNVLESTGKVIRRMRAIRQKMVMIWERFNASPVYHQVMESGRYLLICFLIYCLLVVTSVETLKEHNLFESKFNTVTNSYFACRSEDNKTVANVPKYGMICGTRKKPFKYEGVFANATMEQDYPLDFTVQFQKSFPQNLPKGTIVFEFGLAWQSVNSVYLFGNDILSISGYICDNKIGLCLKNRNGQNVDFYTLHSTLGKSNSYKGRFIIQFNRTEKTVYVFSVAKSKKLIDVYKIEPLGPPMKPVFAIYTNELIQISMTLKSNGPFEYDSSTLHSNLFMSADNRTFSNVLLQTLNKTGYLVDSYIYSSNAIEKSNNNHILTIMNIDFEGFKDTKADLFRVGFGFHENDEFIPLVQIRCFVCSVTLFGFYPMQRYCVSDVDGQNPFTVVRVPVRVQMEYNKRMGTLSLFVQHSQTWQLLKSFSNKTAYRHFPKLFLQKLHAKDIVAWWSKNVSLDEAFGPFAKNVILYFKSLLSIT